MITLNQIKSVMLGHAVGDALGVPVEFTSRESRVISPVTDMIGFGTYNLPAGFWSDDTSMSLATLDSLKNGKVDLKEIMNNFCKWFYNQEYTVDNNVFDIGNTCYYAIKNFHDYKMPVTECGLMESSDNGNGSLMRIHPVALYLYTRKDLTLTQKLEIVHSVSALTHAHMRSKVACGIYSIFLSYILDSAPNKPLCEILTDATKKVKEVYAKNNELDYYDFLLNNIVPNSENIELDQIQSGGYVVTTLEASIYCLLTTNSYKECVLKAVNLGRDTDTVACIAGGLAGAYYGLDEIPTKWLNTLGRADYISEMCEQAFNNWNK